MHAIRKMGNDSAHPATIQLDENEQLTKALFTLFNHIVDSEYTAKKKAD